MRLADIDNEKYDQVDMQRVFNIRQTDNQRDLNKFSTDTASPKPQAANHVASQQADISTSKTSL